MIKAIALDFDDVITATAEQSARNVISALDVYRTQRRLYFVMPSVDQLCRGYDVEWKVGVRKAVPDIDVDDFKIFYDFLSPGFPTYPLIEGAAEAIASLRESTDLLGILSARSESSFLRRADEIGLDLDIFDFYFMKEHLPEQKPSPRALDPFKSELRKRHISENQSIYVGDMPTDHEAAYHAEIPFIGVLTGPKRKHMERIREGLVGRLESIKELPRFIERYNRGEEYER